MFVSTYLTASITYNRSFCSCCCNTILQLAFEKFMMGLISMDILKITSYGSFQKLTLTQEVSTCLFFINAYFNSYISLNVRPRFNLKKMWHVCLSVNFYLLFERCFGFTTLILYTQSSLSLTVCFFLDVTRTLVFKRFT